MIEKIVKSEKNLKITFLIIWLGVVAFIYLFLHGIFIIFTTDSPVISHSPFLSVFITLMLSYLYFHLFIFIKREFTGLIISGIILILLLIISLIPIFENAVFLLTHISLWLSFYIFLLLIKEYFQIRLKLKEFKTK